VVVEELVVSAFFGFSGDGSFAVDESFAGDESALPVFLALPDDELLDLLSFL